AGFSGVTGALEFVVAVTGGVDRLGAASPLIHSNLERKNVKLSVLDCGKTCISRCWIGWLADLMPSVSEVLMSTSTSVHFCSMGAWNGTLKRMPRLLTT